ncbi:uncharacterized protein LOC126271939 isoform X2 [Schistocerca gregaria]|uniref:uncharacterized protein LOC126271939 isoform X2 n=1 Tax=Schistocerca gregaria TaxID=7010 RepID=UPI00211ED7EB|nr:uncharacterized protein LOC126271939 isoform X2 [Schistocerca gregaria]
MLAEEPFVTVVSVDGDGAAPSSPPPAPPPTAASAAPDPTSFVTVVSVGSEDYLDPEEDDAEEVLVYRLPGERLGFGLRFEGGATSSGTGQQPQQQQAVRRLFVQSCAPESPAARALAPWGRLAAGDQILRIDGARVAAMSRADCVRALKDSNVALRLLVRRPQAPPTTPPKGATGGPPAVPPPPVPPRRSRPQPPPPPPPQPPQQQQLVLVGPPRAFADSDCAPEPPEPQTRTNIVDVEAEVEEEEECPSESDDTGSSVSTVVEQPLLQPQLDVSLVLRPFERLERQLLDEQADAGAASAVAAACRCRDAPLSYGDEAHPLCHVRRLHATLQEACEATSESVAPALPPKPRSRKKRPPPPPPPPPPPQPSEAAAGPVNRLDSLLFGNGGGVAEDEVVESRGPQVNGEVSAGLDAEERDRGVRQEGDEEEEEEDEEEEGDEEEEEEEEEDLIPEFGVTAVVGCEAFFPYHWGLASHLDPIGEEDENRCEEDTAAGGRAPTVHADAGPPDADFDAASSRLQIVTTRFSTEVLREVEDEDEEDEWQEALDGEWPVAASHGHVTAHSQPPPTPPPMDAAPAEQRVDAAAQPPPPPPPPPPQPAVVTAASASQDSTDASEEFVLADGGPEHVLLLSVPHPPQGGAADPHLDVSTASDDTPDVLHPNVTLRRKPGNVEDDASELNVTTISIDEDANTRVPDQTLVSELRDAQLSVEADDGLRPSDSPTKCVQVLTIVNGNVDDSVELIFSETSDDKTAVAIESALPVNSTDWAGKVRDGHGAETPTGFATSGTREALASQLFLEMERREHPTSTHCVQVISYDTQPPVKAERGSSEPETTDNELQLVAGEVLKDEDLHVATSSEKYGSREEEPLSDNTLVAKEMGEFSEQRVEDVVVNHEDTTAEYEEAIVDNVQSKDLQISSAKENMTSEIQLDLSSKGGEAEAAKQNLEPALTNGDPVTGEYTRRDTVDSAGDEATLSEDVIVASHLTDTVVQKPVPRARRKPPVVDNVRATLDFLANEAAHSAALNTGQLSDRQWIEIETQEGAIPGERGVQQVETDAVASTEDPKQPEGLLDTAEGVAATGQEGQLLRDHSERVLQVEEMVGSHIEGDTALAESRESGDSHGTVSEELLGTESSGQLLQADEEEKEENFIGTSLLPNDNETEPQIDTFEQYIEQTVETKAMMGDKQLQNETAAFIERERSVLRPADAAVEESVEQEDRKLREGVDSGLGNAEMNTTESQKEAEQVQDLVAVGNDREVQPDQLEEHRSPADNDQGKVQGTSVDERQSEEYKTPSDELEKIGRLSDLQQLEMGPQSDERLSKERGMEGDMCQVEEQDHSQLEDRGVLLDHGQLENHLTPLDPCLLEEDAVPANECQTDDLETLSARHQLEDLGKPTDHLEEQRTVGGKLSEEEHGTPPDKEQSEERATPQSEDLAVLPHRRPSKERTLSDEDELEERETLSGQRQLELLGVPSSQQQLEDPGTPAEEAGVGERRQVEGCGPEPAAMHTDEWRLAQQWEGHVTAAPAATDAPRSRAGGHAMEAAPDATRPPPASPVPPPSASRLPPDGDEFPASYTDPHPHQHSPPTPPALLDHKMDSKQPQPPPPVPSKPWAAPAAPARDAAPTPARDAAPAGRRPRDDASERSVRDKIAMFSQPGAAPAPAPAHAQQPAAASPLRRRFSSAADLSAPAAPLASPPAGLYSRVGGSQLDVRASPLNRSQSFLDLSATPAAVAAPAAATAPARERSADAQQATASLPRRTSFSGTGLLHSRSQSLLDVRAHRNSIAGDPRVGQMMERRQRGLSKLRGLVIPERVPELPVLLPDLPEIKSVPPPPVSTRSSWTPSSSTPTKRTTAPNWTRSGLSTAPLNRPASWQSENVAPLSQNHFSASKPLIATAASPVTSWNSSTAATRENSRPSWSSSASVPKYSPAFKRKSLSVSSSLSSSLSSSREELRPLFEATPNTRPPPLPSSRPPPLQPPAEPKSLESIASSPTRSDISFDFKVGAVRSPSAAPETDVLTPHSRGGGGDDSDDSAVSSSRSSQYSPPSSPLRRTLASGTDQLSHTGRVLKPKSVEAINRKNVLSSARHSSGRDLKAGSPLIQRKMPEDIATEVNSAIVTPIEDNSAIHTQEEKMHQHSQNTENGENNNANLYDRPDDDSTIEHRHVVKQEVVEANRRNINSTPVSHYKTEERLFRAPYSNFDQMNSTLQGKIDDRIAMVHHRTDNSSTTVIRRSMEIVTSVGPSKSTGDKQAPHWSTSRERHTGSVGDDNSSFAGQKEGKNDEVRSNLEAPTDRFDTKEKNNRLSINNNKFEGDETSKHQFATARSKFEDSSTGGRPTYQKSEESKVFPRQRKSDENSAVLRRQNAIEDNILELNGNDPVIDSKSPPVAAPRRYVTQWEASSPSNTPPLESPLSPVPPSVPPKPTSKLSNGSNGSITRQDSGPTLVKHFRGSSLDSTASDDNTLRDSVLYGSVSSLSSASSLITPQELQQLMNEANQSLDESGLCSPVTLEVIVLHRDPAGGGVGITLAGGADYEAKEITVHKVLAGSPADRDGRLQKGDRILSINGHSMKGVTHQESLRILKSPSAEVVLVVMKKGSEGVSSPSYEEPSFGRKMAPFRVLEQLKENSVETVVTSGVLLDGNEGGPPVNLVLCKDGAGLGFSLDGGRDSPLGDRPLTVKKIFTGGAAEKQGQLKAGDELLAVAGSDVTNMTRIEAWTLMKKLPSGPVTISIRPKAAV